MSTPCQYDVPVKYFDALYASAQSSGSEKPNLYI